MEDHFDKILYLIIGLIYTVFSYSTKHAPEKRPVEKMAPLPSASDWEEPWREAPQEIPAPTLYTQPATPSTTVSPKSTTPKIERTLSRYSSWKKAIVMSEIIRPYV